MAKRPDIKSDDGGQGAGPLPTSDGHHDREDLRLIEMAVRKGWKIPEKCAERLPQIAEHIAENGETERDRLRAIELLATLRRDNLAGLTELIKTRRLVNGESTENTAVTFRFADGVNHDAI